MLRNYTLIIIVGCCIRCAALLLVGRSWKTKKIFIERGINVQIKWGSQWTSTRLTVITDNEKRSHESSTRSFSNLLPKFPTSTSRQKTRNLFNAPLLLHLTPVAWLVPAIIEQKPKTPWRSLGYCPSPSRHQHRPQPSVSRNTDASRDRWWYKRSWWRPAWNDSVTVAANRIIQCFAIVASTIRQGRAARIA